MLRSWGLKLKFLIDTVKVAARAAVLGRMARATTATSVKTARARAVTRVYASRDGVRPWVLMDMRYSVSSRVDGAAAVGAWGEPPAHPRLVLLFSPSRRSFRGRPPGR